MEGSFSLRTEAVGQSILLTDGFRLQSLNVAGFTDGRRTRKALLSEQ